MASDLQAPGAAKETPKMDSSLLCRRFPGPSADSLRYPQARPCTDPAVADRQQLASACPRKLIDSEPFGVSIMSKLIFDPE
jgi:hypothetical protein